MEKLIPEALPSKELDSLISKNGIVCSECGGELSKVFKFNMMFRFSAGPTLGNQVALRPETCQSIFLDFLRVYKTMRVKLPIGIAQVGKSFRNEISPRRNLIRLRELTQAEIEVFFNPKKIESFTKFDRVMDVTLRFSLVNDQELELTAEKAVKKKIVQNKLVVYYLVLLKQFYELVGINPQNIRYRELHDEERPFYAQSAWDLEIKTSLGWLEVVANHYRTDYDLKVHSKGSKTDLRILDNGEKILPWVWEDSMGIDRTLFVALDAAYTEEKKRVFLKLPNYLAPIQVAVFPLVDKDGLTEKARTVYDLLKGEIDAFFDEKASIGRRYYRVDEIGVPYSVTIDYDTLKDETVTIRDRDSKEQIRIKIDALKDWLKLRLNFIPPN
jgi:glycyl-tRNA synthetase